MGKPIENIARANVMVIDAMFPRAREIPNVTRLAKSSPDTTELADLLKQGHKEIDFYNRNIKASTMKAKLGFIIVLLNCIMTPGIVLFLNSFILSITPEYECRPYTLSLSPSAALLN